MTAHAINPGTVDITRAYPVPVKDLFSAWTTKEALLAWSAPGEGWEMSFDAFDFRVGHVDLCLFGPIGAEPYVNAATYHDIVTNRSIRQTATLSRAGKVSFVGAVSIEFRATGEASSELRLIETGLYPAGVDSVEDHEAGWSGMLDGLGAYLETRTAKAA